MTRNETIPPSTWEEKFGLGQVLSELFHIISHNWSTFISEAELHLQNISRVATSSHTSHEQQKSLSLDLHQLSPLWKEVRRRIVGAKDAARQMIYHPFFATSGGVQSIESYLGKIIATFDDLEKRTEELDANTNILINLIFNLATFNDTAVAIQETKAANSLARSIRRVAMLTFFYLPLQISASIFGMNVHEITGNDGDHRIWEYVVLSFSLMALTFCVAGPEYPIMVPKVCAWAPPATTADPADEKGSSWIMSKPRNGVAADKSPVIHGWDRKGVLVRIEAFLTGGGPEMVLADVEICDRSLMHCDLTGLDFGFAHVNHRFEEFHAMPFTDLGRSIGYSADSVDAALISGDLTTTPDDSRHDDWLLAMGWTNALDTGTFAPSQINGVGGIVDLLQLQVLLSPHHLELSEEYMSKECNLAIFEDEKKAGLLEWLEERGFKWRLLWLKRITVMSDTSRELMPFGTRGGPEV
ncbi:hypothetical protein DHEL01_v202973 [Diaporthe helianthi]|uniref:Uncharacterized protein n=1 Tax=Diaporthe helianthi TaxID=158607 RepID=A0A2P5I7Y2_DIAHE|nr:hypothetical protein DHEL01_v202973 [Diaporthe helianthi]